MTSYFGNIFKFNTYGWLEHRRVRGDCHRFPLDFPYGTKGIRIARSQAAKLDFGIRYPQSTLQRKIQRQRQTETARGARVLVTDDISRCRPRSRSPSTATTRGTPSCSAMADCECTALSNRFPPGVHCAFQGLGFGEENGRSGRRALVTRDRPDVKSPEPSTVRPRTGHRRASNRGSTIDSGPEPGSPVGDKWTNHDSNPSPPR